MLHIDCCTAGPVLELLFWRGRQQTGKQKQLLTGGPVPAAIPKHEILHFLGEDDDDDDDDDQIVLIMLFLLLVFARSYAIK